MSINNLEKEGLRALFKRDTDRIDSIIAEKMKILAESQSHHQVFRDNLRADIIELKGIKRGYVESMNILRTAGLL